MSARKRASLSASDFSASLREVTSAFVPLARSARPEASRTVTMPRVRIQRHEPSAAADAVFVVEALGRPLEHREAAAAHAPDVVGVDEADEGLHRGPGLGRPLPQHLLPVRVEPDGVARDVPVPDGERGPSRAKCTRSRSRASSALAFSSAPCRRRSITKAMPRRAAASGSSARRNASTRPIAAMGRRGVSHGSGSSGGSAALRSGTIAATASRSPRVAASSSSAPRRPASGKPKGAEEPLKAWPTARITARSPAARAASSRARSARRVERYRPVELADVVGDVDLGIAGAGTGHVAALAWAVSRAGALQLREEDHVADRGAVGEQHHQPVDADALAGGRAAGRTRARGCSRRRSTSPPRRRPPSPAPAAAKRAAWSSGSFSSEKPLAISRPAMKSSKRSVTAGFASLRARERRDVGRVRDDEGGLDELRLGGRLEELQLQQAQPVGREHLDLEGAERRLEVLGLRELGERVLAGCTWRSPRPW